MNKKAIIISSVVLILLLLVVIILVILKGNYMNFSKKVVLEGIIQEVHENNLILQPTDNTIREAVASISLAKVKLDNYERSRLQPGIKIKVTYDGKIMESYPVQIIAIDIKFFN